MRLLRPRVIVRITVAVVLFNHVVPANGQTSGAKSLRGLTSVAVKSIVELDCAGFIDSKALQTDIEVRLRVAGLKIDTGNWAGLGPMNGSLQAHVACVPVTVSGLTVGVAANTKVEFTQSVVLVRLPLLEVDAADKEILAVTWGHIGTILLCKGDTCSNTIRRTVSDGIDAFINDFLKINPQ